MDRFHESLQSLNLQQTPGGVHDEVTNCAISSPSAVSSQDLFQLQESLYAAFQHTASCITQLYKQKADPVSRELDGERWQAFQRAAAAATVLFREASDAVRKAQEVAKLSEAKSQSTLCNTLQQAKRPRRSNASSKRHSSTSPQLNVSGAMSTLDREMAPFSGSTAASNNNINVSLSDGSDDDSTPVVIRSGTGTVLELGIGASSSIVGSCGRAEANSGASGCARKRGHTDDLLFSAEVNGGSSNSSASRIGDPLPLPADFERASVEYFREQKRARF